MATMRRDPVALVAAVLGGLLSGAHAQKLDIKPGLDVLATATTNASDNASQPRKDLVISVVPQLNVGYQGPRVRVDGQLRVEQVHFVRDSQPDQTLPSGHLALHTDLVEQWGGLDAAVQTSQTPANLLARSSETPGTTESYTTTRASIAPFIAHAFDANTHWKARLEESLTKSSEATPGLAKRPDLRLSSYSTRLERRPTPLGASLEWGLQETQVSGQPEPALRENSVRGGVSYALNEQVQLGLIAGRESIHVLLAQQSETIRGLNLLWRPNERATLDATAEHRFFGTGWKVDWSHRMPFLAWNLVSERDASTYASALGTLGAGQSLRGMLDGMLTTYNPDNKARADLVDKTLAQRGLTDQLASAQDIYSLQASLRQSLLGRFVIMGQRNTVTFSAGVNKTAPLPLDTAIVNPAQNADHTQERYLDALFSRRLTPFTTFNAGARWGLSNVTSTLNPGTSGRSRTLIWRSALNTRLSNETTATIGLRHQTTEGRNQTTTGDESAMFVGLGYRY